MRRLLRAAVPVGLLVALFAQQAAVAASTANVSIVDFAFNPSQAKIHIGDSVEWTNTGTVTHTSTSDGFDACCPNGAALWKSGNLAPNATFTQLFSVAGAFSYHCSIHTFMTGKIGVLGQAVPRRGHVDTSFTVSWAAAPGVPTGFTEDIQIKRPGSNRFVIWLAGQGAGTTSAQFTPDAGTGPYQFRFRLNNIALGTSSAFSPATSIQVS